MRFCPLPAATVLCLSASAQELRERPGAATSSIVIVQNASVRDPDETAGTPLVADGVDSVTIAVAIRDGSGKPIADLRVRIDVTGSRNAVTPGTTGFTDANGLFIANLTTTAAEAKTIAAVADPGPSEVVLEDRPGVAFRAGPATRVEVALDGAGRPVAFIARDFFGNLAGEIRASSAEH